MSSEKYIGLDVHQATISVAVVDSQGKLIMESILQQHGVSWKYSETGLGTILLVWCLLSAFRPEWRKRRFWLVMAGIVVLHLIGWVSLASRIERFGFALMLLLVIVEIMLGASVILKAIPEDYQVMVDYIHRW
jgi:hypothetical protein